MASRSSRLVTICIFFYFLICNLVEKARGNNSVTTFLRCYAHNWHLHLHVTFIAIQRICEHTHKLILSKYILRQHRMCHRGIFDSFKPQEPGYDDIHFVGCQEELSMWDVILEPKCKIFSSLKAACGFFVLVWFCIFVYLRLLGFWWWFIDFWGFFNRPKY